MPDRPSGLGSLPANGVSPRRSPYSRQQRRRLLRQRQRLYANPPRFGWRSLLQTDAVDSPNYSTRQTFSLIIAMLLMGASLPLLLSPRVELTRSRPVSAKLTKPIVALRRAIISKESDDNYRAINPHSKAIGYAQILPENLPRWSQQVFGREVSQAEFLANPELQVQLIEFKLDQYWQEELQASGGNEAIAVRKVASRWYAGRADLYDSPQPQMYKGVRYPSIRAYTQAVLKKYRQERSH